MMASIEITPKLGITVGLPLSGKSSFCKQEQSLNNAVIICPNTIRKALHGELFIPTAEPFVWAITETTIRALLMDSHSVILDACNNSVKRREIWTRMAAEFNIQLTIYNMEPGYDVCTERNTKQKRYDQSVIDGMYKRWEPVQPGEGNIITVKQAPPYKFRIGD
jgi:predicted kinase